MSKLTIELITEEIPGADEEIGLNERKPSACQYFLQDKLLKVYLGKKSKLTPDKVRKTLSDADWKNYSETEVELSVGSLGAKEVEAAYEIIALKSFIFDKYKTDPAKRHVQVKKISCKPKRPEGFDLAVKEEVISAIKFCRDIISTNADTITPAQMQRFAEELAKDCKEIKVKTIDHKQAAKQGMDCLLAVGAESISDGRQEHFPRLVVLEYTGKNYKTSAKQNSKHIAFVSKGVTFDTGGLCLKPTKYMYDMKSDMTGAATILATFKAISNLSSKLSSNIKITGVMCLAENAFGGGSYKPGDVLKACNGTTVQVVDTDAEGRLVLADGLAYVSQLKDKPSKLIDVATLTGSIVSTLGEAAAGAMTNNDSFLQDVVKAFTAEGEKLWQMPMFDDYKGILDSEIADIKHCNTRPDGICAAIFLKEFVDPKIDWVHLDIAGVGFIEEDGLWAYKGATGFGVKSLTRYLMSI